MKERRDVGGWGIEKGYAWARARGEDRDRRRRRKRRRMYRERFTIDPVTHIINLHSQRKDT